jgi:hypothetical protein
VTSPQQLVSLITQITQEDLATTIQIANSVTPPDLEAAQCASFLQGFIPTLAGPAHTFIQPTGVASTLETLRIAAMQASTGVGLSSVQHQALDIACGPLAINVEFQVATGIMSLPTTPGAFLQMLLALAHANVPPVAAVPVVVPVAPVQPPQQPFAPAYRPIPPKPPTPPRAPTPAQISAYGQIRLASTVHEWTVP